MNRESSTRVEEVTDLGKAFFSWLLTYADQEAAIDCNQSVLVAAFRAGAAWERAKDGTP
jgi:hypothetical protein